MSDRIGRVFKIHKDSMICSVDFGKFWFYGYCRSSDGGESKVRRFPNTGQGFRRFEEFVNSFKRQHPCELVVIGFEPTGSFAIPFIYFWHKRDVQLVQINPMHTKRMKEVADNSPNKTDKKDPRVIADVIEMGRSLSVVVPEGVVADLRALIHGRERMCAHRKSMSNQLQDIVFTLFPEFVGIMKGVESKTAWYLLRNCPTPQSLLGAHRSQLLADIRRISRGRIGEERFDELLQAARHSGGLRAGCESLVLQIQQHLSYLEQMSQSIAQLEEAIYARLPEVPGSSILLSIKGLGALTVAAIIGEFADMKAFRTVDAVMKFAGLNLYEVSSGKHQGQRRIAKRGRSVARKYLYFAVLTLIRTNEEYRQLYHSRVHPDTIRNKVVISLCRRLLRTMYSILRNHTQYEQRSIMKEAA